MSTTWRTTNAHMATPEIRWNAQASIPSLPRYRSSMLPPMLTMAPLADRRSGDGGRRSQAGDDGVGHVARPGRTAEVVGHRPPLSDDRDDGRLHPFGGLDLAEMAQHEDARQEESGRVRLVQA